ncbi:MAG TPA: MaoC family dehydratase [Acetobacteraceae bacterium]|nr:MaoC family dehydratase [Acetobacteraceae bacterium]
MSDPAPESADDIKQELAGMVGPIGEAEKVPVEYLSAMRMAMAVEDFDPIHYDARAAQARGYRGIVAPWPILSLMQYNCSHELPRFSFGRATVHGEDGFEFHEPIIVGDVITVTAAVTDAQLKRGRSGLLGLVTWVRRFANQLDQLCAVSRTIVIRR